MTLAKLAAASSLAGARLDAADRGAEDRPDLRAKAFIIDERLKGFRERKRERIRCAHFARGLLDLVKNFHHGATDQEAKGPPGGISDVVEIVVIHGRIALAPGDRECRDGRSRLSTSIGA